MGRFSKCRVIFRPKLSKCEAQSCQRWIQSQPRTAKNERKKFQRYNLKGVKMVFRVVSNNSTLLETQWEVRRDGCNSYRAVKLLSACTYLLFYHNILKLPSVSYSLCSPCVTFFFNLFSFSFSPYYPNSIFPLQSRLI